MDQFDGFLVTLGAMLDAPGPRGFDDEDLVTS